MAYIPPAPRPPQLVFEVFDPASYSKAGVRAKARQLEYFTETEIWPYYTDSPMQGGLGLQYIDTEPYSLEDRIDLLQYSGSRSIGAARHYIFGYKINAKGRAPAIRPDTLRALGIVTVGACESEHEPVLINEIDVAKDLRCAGYGRRLMSIMLGLAHTEDTTAQLDVYANNTLAHLFYHDLGFRPDINTPLQAGSVFNMTKQRLHGQIDSIKAALASD